MSSLWLPASTVQLWDIPDGVTVLAILNPDFAYDKGRLISDPATQQQRLESVWWPWGPAET